MADIFDRAQECEALFRQDALAYAAEAARNHGAESRTTCLDCGAAIPEARRKAVPGVQRCIHCQTELEGSL